LAQLLDGRILAFDRQDRTPVYLMTPQRAPDGTYWPARSGTVEVRRGTVGKVSSNAASSSASLATLGGPTRSAQPSSRVGTIVDLRDGRLLLVRDGQAFILQVSPAPDGQYTTATAGVLEVQGGT